MAQVPDIPNFTLQDVVDVVNPTVHSLDGCFTDAADSKFDSTYVGNKDRLSNFRNYGALVIEVNPTTILLPWSLSQSPWYPSATINVLNSSNWTLNSYPSWVRTITDNHTANTVWFELEANYDNPYERVGNITVAEGTDTATTEVTQERQPINTQDIASTEPEDHNTTLNYRLGLAPVNASSNSAWIQVTSVSAPDASHQGFINLHLDENLGAQRTATISYTDATSSGSATVTQERYALVLTPSPVNVDGATSGGIAPSAVTVNVIHAIDPWGIKTQPASWVTATEDTNNDKISLSFAANATKAARSTSMVVHDNTNGTITEVTLTINQSYITPTVTPDTFTNISADGDTLTATLAYAINPSIVEYPAWASVSLSSNTVTITVDANPDTTSRTGDVVISASGTTLTISLTQLEKSVSLSLSPSSGSDTCWKSGSGSFSVVTNASSWSASESISWITKTEDHTNNKVNFTYTDNDTLASRSGNITVTADGASATYHFSQGGGTMVAYDASWNESPDELDGGGCEGDYYYGYYGGGYMFDLSFYVIGGSDSEFVSAPPEIGQLLVIKNSAGDTTFVTAKITDVTTHDDTDDGDEYWAIEISKITENQEPSGNIRVYTYENC